MIVDTTFVIDLEREILSRQPGPAMEVGESLVTRDRDNFSRITGLAVLGY